MPSSSTLLLGLLLLLSLPPHPSDSAAFSLDFFPGDGDGDGDAISQLALSGGANASANGNAISMPSPHALVQYSNPIPIPTPFSFSTYFAFSFDSGPNASLAFFLAPYSRSRSQSQPSLLAVVFAASGRIRIDIAGHAAVQSHNISKPKLRLHSWIDYNDTTGTLHVRLSASRLPKPPAALLHHLLPLPAGTGTGTTQKQHPRAGFSFAGGAHNASSCSLFSWAFHARQSQGAPALHSQPLDPSHLLTTPPLPPETLRRHRPAPAEPDRYRGWGWGGAVSLLLAAACGGMVTFLALFLWYSYSMAARRHPVAPVELAVHDVAVVYEKMVLVVGGPGAGGNNNK